MNSERILVVDDEEAIREVVSTLLEAQGYKCRVASSGLRALPLLESDEFDLVLSDIVMPDMNGLELLEQVRQRDHNLPFIMVTALHDISTALEAIRRGAYDYILKPFERDQLFLGVRRALEHRRLVKENQKYQEGLEKLVTDRTTQLTKALVDLEQSYDYTLEALGSALDLKDAETEGHCQRVTAYTVCIAKRMNVDPVTLRHIARGAFLHDIGKMAVPDSILRKPGPLTPDEWKVMERHCEVGFAVLQRIPFLSEAAQIVLTHQEKYDGTGYPQRLKGDQIPLGARVFAVADTLDAMISDRPYRSALSVAAAQDEIKRCSGTQFDPKVVNVFLTISERVWLDIRENMGAPFQLSDLKDL
jgi:putative nucleotidyltransferase with HDIG domain